MNRPATRQPSLAGCRVLVTRAPHQAAPLLDALAAHGAEAEACPVLAIESVPGEAPDLGAFDLVVITSPNGVDHLSARLGARTWPAGLTLAVVGPGTAARAGDQGWPVTLQPAAATGEALSAALDAAGLAPGVRVLRVRGDLAPPLIEEALQGRGADVTALTVYRTVPVTPPVSAVTALEAGTIDAVTFASPSAVRFLLAGAPGVDLPRRTVAACIGPVTTRAARDAGWTRICEAAEATSAALAQALADFMDTDPQSHA